MSFFEELKQRGLVYSATPGIEKIFERKTTLYLGIDPTADSLHIGHFLGLSLLKRAYESGNRIIIIMGGGTALIGDPSGKEKERPILPQETIERNKKNIKKQIEKFFKIDGERVKIIDNALWLKKISLIEFLRDAGKNVSVNSMLDLEFVRERIKNQRFLSFAEFTYQLLQAYDFYQLFIRENCEVQIGGSDQWGNIIQGVELIKKKTGKQAYGLAFPLITDPATGKKFGKTESGKAIWLDRKKTSPFELYQFLLNTSDELSKKLLFFYSFKPIEEIKRIIKKAEENPEKRITQKTLADELLELVHTKEDLEICQAATHILFEKSFDEISFEDAKKLKKALQPIPAPKEAKEEELLVASQLASSKKQARQLLKQKGVKFKKLNNLLIIKKGKKHFALVELK